MADVLRFSEHQEDRERVQFVQDGPVYTVKNRGDLTPAESIEHAEILNSQVQTLANVENIRKSTRASADDLNSMIQMTRESTQLRIRLIRLALFDAPTEDELMGVPEATLTRFEAFLGGHWRPQRGTTTNPTKPPTPRRGRRTRT